MVKAPSPGERKGKVLLTSRVTLMGFISHVETKPSTPHEGIENPTKCDVIAAFYYVVCPQPPPPVKVPAAKQVSLVC